MFPFKLVLVVLVQLLVWLVTQTPPDLQAAQAQARAAEDSAAQHREEAAQATKRVAEVEKEMRTLLNAMERQKKASALKMQQLATVVHDLQRPFLSWAPSM